MAQSKTCSRCNVEKSLDDFYGDKTRKDGLDYNCKDCHRISDRKSRNKHLKKRREYNKIYDSNPINYQRRLKNDQKYRRKKRKTDPIWRMGQIIKQYLHRALNSKKRGRSEELVGYNKKMLTEHIERLWEDWMSWDNYGTEWEIDHIIPVQYYLDKGITDPSIIHNLENLRPLCRLENRKKGKRCHI